MNPWGLTRIMKAVVITGLVIASFTGAAIVVIQTFGCMDLPVVNFDMYAEHITPIPGYHEWKLTLTQFRPGPHCGKFIDVNKISLIIYNETSDKMAEWPPPIGYNDTGVAPPKVCFPPLTSCILIDNNNNKTFDVGDYIYLTLAEGVTGFGWRIDALHDGETLLTESFD